MTALALPDLAALSDLRTFVGRARRIEDGGAIRLVAQGQILAMYAAALHGGGGPTVLALRVLALAAPATVDATVPLSSMVDRFARIDRVMAAARPTPRGLGRPIEMPVPPTTATDAGWAGVLPPRSGWSIEGTVTSELLRAAARAGIDEVAAGAPTGSPGAAVARLRALVWGRPLAGTGMPTGAAFAAEAFGFLGAGSGAADPGAADPGVAAGQGEEPTGPSGAATDPATLHVAGPWWRLSTTRGHLLARAGSVLG